MPSDVIEFKRCVLPYSTLPLIDMENMSDATEDFVLSPELSELLSVELSTIFEILAAPLDCEGVTPHRQRLPSNFVKNLFELSLKAAPSPTLPWRSIQRVLVEEGGATSTPFLDGDVFSVVPYIFHTFLPRLIQRCCAEWDSAPVVGVVKAAVDVVVSLLFFPVMGAVNAEGSNAAALADALWVEAIPFEPSSLERLFPRCVNLCELRDVLRCCTSGTSRDVALSLGLLEANGDAAAYRSDSESDDSVDDRVVVQPTIKKAEGSDAGNAEKTSKRCITSLLMSLATSRFFNALVRARYIEEVSRVLAGRGKSDLEGLRMSCSSLHALSQRALYNLWGTTFPSLLTNYLSVVVAPVARIRHLGPNEMVTAPSEASPMALDQRTLESVVRNHLYVDGFASTINMCGRLLNAVADAGGASGSDPASHELLRGVEPVGLYFPILQGVAATFVSEVFGLVAASEPYCSESVISHSHPNHPSSVLSLMRAHTEAQNVKKQTRIEAQISAIVKRELLRAVAGHSDAIASGHTCAEDVEAQLRGVVTESFLSRAPADQRPVDTMHLHSSTFPVEKIPHPSTISNSSGAASVEARNLLSAAVVDAVALCGSSLMQLCLHSADTYWASLTEGRMAIVGRSMLGNSLSAIELVRRVSTRRRALAEATIFSDDEPLDDDVTASTAVTAADCGSELHCLRQVKLRGAFAVGDAIPLRLEVSWTSSAIAGVLLHRLDLCIQAMNGSPAWSSSRARIMQCSNLLLEAEDARRGVSFGIEYEDDESGIQASAALFIQSIESALAHLCAAVRCVVGDSIVRRIVGQDNETWRLLVCLYEAGPPAGVANIPSIVRRAHTRREQQRYPERTLVKCKQARLILGASGLATPVFEYEPSGGHERGCDQLSWWLSAVGDEASGGTGASGQTTLSTLVLPLFGIPCGASDDDNEAKFNEIAAELTDPTCHRGAAVARAQIPPLSVADGGVATSLPEGTNLPLMSPTVVVLSLCSALYADGLTFAPYARFEHLVPLLRVALSVEMDPASLKSRHISSHMLPHSTLTLSMHALLLAYGLYNSGQRTNGRAAFDFPDEFISADVKRDVVLRKLVSESLDPRSGSCAHDVRSFELSTQELAGAAALVAMATSEVAERRNAGLNLAHNSTQKFLASIGIQYTQEDVAHGSVRVTHTPNTTSSSRAVRAMLAAGIFPPTPHTDFNSMVGAGAVLLSTGGPLEHNPDTELVVDSLANACLEGDLRGDVSGASDWYRAARCPKMREHYAYLKALLDTATLCASVEHRTIAARVFEQAVESYSARSKGKLLMSLLGADPGSEVAQLLLNTIGNCMADGREFVTHEFARALVAFTAATIEQIKGNERGAKPPLPANATQPIRPAVSERVSIVLLPCLNLLSTMLTHELATVRRLPRDDPSLFAGPAACRSLSLWGMADAALAWSAVNNPPTGREDGLAKPVAVVLQPASCNGRPLSLLCSQRSLSSVCSCIVADVVSPLRGLLAEEGGVFGPLDAFSIERALDVVMGQVRVV